MLLLLSADAHEIEKLSALRVNSRLSLSPRLIIALQTSPLTRLHFFVSSNPDTSIFCFDVVIVG